MVGHSEIILPRLATRLVSDPAETFMRWVLVYYAVAYAILCPENLAKLEHVADVGRKGWICEDRLLQVRCGYAGLNGKCEQVDGFLSVGAEQMSA